MDFPGRQHTPPTRSRTGCGCSGSLAPSFEKFAFDDAVSKDIRNLERRLAECVADSEDDSLDDESLDELEKRECHLNKERSRLKALQRPLLHPPRDLTHGLLTRIQINLTDLTLFNIPLTQLHSLSAGSFPLLSRLALSLTVGTGFKRVEITPSISPLLCFTGSPHLRYLAATNLPPGDHIKFSWAQLTHLLEFQCYPDPTWHFLYTHIHSALRLTHLHVSLDEFQARVSSLRPGIEAGRLTLPFNPVVLPELRKLSIYCPRNYGREMPPEFRDRFDFPKIEELQIVKYNIYMGEDRSWGPGDVDAFTRKFRGWTRLTRLSLYDVYWMPADSFKIILNAMPHLTALELAPESERLEVLVLGGDSCDPSKNRLVPNLRHLVLHNDATMHLDTGEWVLTALEVISSRVDVRRRGLDDEGLQKVTLYAPNLSAGWVKGFVEGTSEAKIGVRLDVEIKEKRANVYPGWQFWGEMDEGLHAWAGAGEVAIKDARE
ncbi:hypothetical protein NMY22_g7360 [Coprinellus aureogranulatus]|nr:hypothetical protein NMY22_g7360 [Coprinellus aureogranulatus]